MLTSVAPVSTVKSSMIALLMRTGTLYVPPTNFIRAQTCGQITRHGGQRLMAWAVANARVEPKGNAIVITKQASGSAIDPLTAAFNAIALMSTNPWSHQAQIFVI